MDDIVREALEAFATAAVRLAWDRDADCIYVTASYGVREATPILHAAALKPWGS